MDQARPSFSAAAVAIVHVSFVVDHPHLGDGRAGACSNAFIIGFYIVPHKDGPGVK